MLHVITIVRGIGVVCRPGQQLHFQSFRSIHRQSTCSLRFRHQSTAAAQPIVQGDRSPRLLPLPIPLVLLDKLLFKWQKAIGDFRIMVVFVAEIQVVSQPSQVVRLLLYRDMAAGSSLLIGPRDRGGMLSMG